MGILVELEERTEGINASYFLLVSRGSQKKEIYLGRALKDTTFEDGMRTMDLHSERMSAAAEFKAGYQPPTPTILQYFSRKPLENILKDGVPANIHPNDEINLFKRIMEELVKIDPSIKKSPRDPVITQIGSHPVDYALHERLQQAYDRFALIILGA